MADAPSAQAGNGAVSLEGTGFDVNQYLERYSGSTAFQRALFIAQRCPEAAQAAASFAAQGLKRSTLNAELYKNVVGRFGAQSGEPGGQIDTAWVSQAEKRFANQQEHLQGELAQYKANLVRDKIRAGHNALGELYLQRGDLGSALKCFVRTRDYVQSPQHIVEMCMSVIKVSIEMGNFAHVMNYVSKAEQQTSAIAGDELLVAQLSAVNGLALLSSRKYKLAARKFVNCPNQLVLASKMFDSVISPNDVAVYGLLTALATYERSELRRLVLDNKTFGPYMELEPELKQVALDFYHSNYAACLDGLDRLRPVFLLDYHLHEHVSMLFQKIRSRAMIQYFSPYSSTDLNRMGVAFNTPVDELEGELARLIMEDQIQARIDSHGKRMYTSESNQRVETFERALRNGAEYADHMEELILRSNVMRKDFLYRTKSAGGGPDDSRVGRRNKRDKTEA